MKAGLKVPAPTAVIATELPVDRQGDLLKCFIHILVPLRLQI